jgi:hypothetical protein
MLLANKANCNLRIFWSLDFGEWITTVVPVTRFLVLTLSGFRINTDMGWMSAITISMVLSMDFPLLPTLLKKVDAESDTLT